MTGEEGEEEEEEDAKKMGEEKGISFTDHRYYLALSAFTH